MPLNTVIIAIIVIVVLVVVILLFSGQMTSFIRSLEASSCSGPDCGWLPAPLRTSTDTRVEATSGTISPGDPIVVNVRSESEGTTYSLIVTHEG